MDWTQNLTTAYYQDMIKQYCSSIDNNLFYLTIVIFIMVLFDNKMKQWLNDNEKLMKELFGQSEQDRLSGKTIYFFYKWLTLGLIFMLGLGLLTKGII